jgi:hypothetical protein
MIQNPGKPILQGDTTVWKQGATAYAESFENSQQERDRYDAAKAATWVQLLDARDACRAAARGIDRLDELLNTAPAGTPADVRVEWRQQRDAATRDLMHVQLELQTLCNRMADFGELHNADW